MQYKKKMTGIDFNTTLNNLVASLKPSDPYRIVLFGSHANGTPNEHSDIDLMVILDTTMYQKHIKNDWTKECL